MYTSKAAVQRGSVKKVFLEIPEIHRKTPVPECFLIKACNFIKKEALAHMNFAKFLRTTFLKEHPSVAAFDTFIFNENWSFLIKIMLWIFT